IPVQSSSFAFSNGSRPSAPPALLIRTSTRPNRLRTSPTKRSTLSLSVTSSSRASPAVPTALFTRSTRRAPPTTVYPRFARARALRAAEAKLATDEASGLYAMQNTLRRLRGLALGDRNAEERLKILSSELRKAVQDRFEQLELLPFGHL